MRRTGGGGRRRLARHAGRHHSIFGTLRVAARRPTFGRRGVFRARTVAEYPPRRALSPTCLLRPFFPDGVSATSVRGTETRKVGRGAPRRRTQRAARDANSAPRPEKSRGRQRIKSAEVSRSGKAPHEISAPPRFENPGCSRFARSRTPAGGPPRRRRAAAPLDSCRHFHWRKGFEISGGRF